MKKGAAGTEAGKKPPVIRRMVMKTGKSIMTIKRKRNITNSFFGGT